MLNFDAFKARPYPMNQNSFIHQSSYEISTRDADFQHDVRVSSIINCFIQAAWKHAEELGFGYSHLSENGVGWILSRLKIKIEKVPSWPGILSLRTWPKGLKRLFYIRDAEVIDDGGDRIASVVTYWIVIDMKSKRPKLLNYEPEAMFYNKNLQALDEEIPSLKAEGSLVNSSSNRVGYNDIDMNWHLTTIRYFELMFDTYDDLGFIQNHYPKDITVNFIKEIAFGTEISVNRFENGNIHLFEIVNQANNIVCFRGEVKY